VLKSFSLLQNILNPEPCWANNVPTPSRLPHIRYAGRGSWLQCGSTLPRQLIHGGTSTAAAIDPAFKKRHRRIARCGPGVREGLGKWAPRSTALLFEPAPLLPPLHHRRHFADFFLPAATVFGASCRCKAMELELDDGRVIPMPPSIEIETAAAAEPAAAPKRGRPAKRPKRGQKAAAAPKKRQSKPSARAKAAASKKAAEAKQAGPQMTARPEVALVEKHHKVARSPPDPPPQPNAAHRATIICAPSERYVMNETPQDMMKIVDRLKRIDEYGFFVGIAEGMSPEKVCCTSFRLRIARTEPQPSPCGYAGCHGDRSCARPGTGHGTNLRGAILVPRSHFPAGALVDWRLSLFVAR